MTRVLIVDDEPQILRALQINLQIRQYSVATAPDGPRDLDKAARVPPDAVILDLGLPGLGGIDVIRALRVWCAAPVIVLSVTATEENENLRLTPTEWRILTVLINRPGSLVTGSELLLSVWGPGHERKTNYLRVHLSGIRRKLEPDPAHPRHLLTEPGMGYRYQP